MDDPARKVNVLDAGGASRPRAALGRARARLPATARRRAAERQARLVHRRRRRHAIGAITDRAEVLAIVRRAHAAFSRLAALPRADGRGDRRRVPGRRHRARARLRLADRERGAAHPDRAARGAARHLPRLRRHARGCRGSSGCAAALDLILTGRTLDARRAERIGLVARAVPAAWLIEHAHRRLAELAKRPPEQPPRPLPPAKASGAPAARRHAFGRAIAFRQAPAR